MITTLYCRRACFSEGEMTDQEAWDAGKDFQDMETMQYFSIRDTAQLYYGHMISVLVTPNCMITIKPTR